MSVVTSGALRKTYLSVAYLDKTLQKNFASGVEKNMGTDKVGKYMWWGVAMPILKVSDVFLSFFCFGTKPKFGEKLKIFFDSFACFFLHEKAAKMPNCQNCV